jgi:uncharacterized protein (TIGR03066 family)
MRAIRSVLSLTILLVLGASLNAADDRKDDKDYAKKIVGKWKAAKDRHNTVVEFAKDGTLTISATDKDKKPEVVATGKYSFEADKLVVDVKFKDGKEKRTTLTIVKLTDESLITSEREGKPDEFTREK